MSVTWIILSLIVWFAFIFLLALIFGLLKAAGRKSPKP
jgi:hypothetical protein